LGLTFLPFLLEVAIFLRFCRREGSLSFPKAANFASSTPTEAMGLHLLFRRAGVHCFSPAEQTFVSQERRF
jgi:hypothetical protein